jgi:fumarate reductase subunit C
MELLFSVLCILSIMLLWFIIVMLVAKKTVGKDAKTWQIFTFLFVAGPVGWAVLLIIAVMELIDIAFPNLFKGK